MSISGKTNDRRASLLHGTLEVIIKDATLPCLYSGLQNMHVSITLGRTIMAKTTEEKNPTWNQSFKILCAHPSSTNIVLKVRNKNWVILKVSVPASRLTAAGDRTYNSSSSATRWRGPPLRFSLRFVPAAAENLMGWGLREGVTFPERENCGLVFYQDAHHHRSFAPPVYGGRGRKIPPRKLWEDIYSAIDGAQHLIYIAGWAFNPKIVLVRDPDTDLPQARGVQIGELLKRKAREGVAVRIMLWDDETSLPKIKNPGLMQTLDEDAFSFFSNTQVICHRFGRDHHGFPTVFTHHQKTLTLDSLSSNAHSREIVSFLGGLDFYNGRYDTEDHPLFIHGVDFYQPSIASAAAAAGDPRQPWHDVHCRVSGAAALDVLANFEHRWCKQSIPNLLLPRNQTLISASFSYSGDWNAQIFRSIDNLSAIHLPEKRSMESSIHEAYVASIRRARRFIYIENQYFLGGSILWNKEQKSGCENLVPLEIALKIAEKIRIGESFRAYVVVPMWPEGVPETPVVMEILHWQRRTMEMMYRVVGEAMREKGVGGSPREYLSFFCLGKREMPEEREMVREVKGQGYDARRSRRFMVYVHSKLMIVDDEYLLMGSANINQRSMDGERDTEIAIGCYQPTRRNNGGVRDFRLLLWYEHTGGAANKAFDKPESDACARELNKIGDNAWRAYSGGAATDMGGVHLVSYPVEVSHDGRLGDGGFFPDTRALIRGKKQWCFPPIFTT